MPDSEECPVTELVRRITSKKKEMVETFFVWAIRSCGGILGIRLCDHKFTRQGITSHFSEFPSLITMPSSAGQLFGQYVLSLTQHENGDLSNLIGLCMGRNAASIINQFHDIAIVSDHITRVTMLPPKERARWSYCVPKRHVSNLRKRMVEYKHVFNAMSVTWKARIALNAQCTKINVSRYSKNDIASIMCKRYFDLLFIFLDRSDIKRPTYIIAQQFLAVLIFHLIDQLKDCDHPILQTLSKELRLMFVTSLGAYHYPKNIELFIKNRLLEREGEYFVRYVEQKLAVNHYQPKYINCEVDQYEQYELNMIKFVVQQLNQLTFLQKIGLLAYLDYHHPDCDAYDQVSDDLYESAPSYYLPQWAATFLIHTAVHNNYSAALSQLFSYCGSRFSWVKILNVVQYSIHDNVKFSKIPQLKCLKSDEEYVYLPDYKVGDSPMTMPIIAESIM